MVSLRDVPKVQRFGLASLLLFVTIVAFALALPRMCLAVGATLMFFLMGAFVIKCGWQAATHRVFTRTAATSFGLALIAAGAWVLVVVWPR